MCLQERHIRILIFFSFSLAVLGERHAWTEIYSWNPRKYLPTWNFRWGWCRTGPLARMGNLQDSCNRGIGRGSRASRPVPETPLFSAPLCAPSAPGSPQLACLENLQLDSFDFWGWPLRVHLAIAIDPLPACRMHRIKRSQGRLVMGEDIEGKFQTNLFEL